MFSIYLFLSCEPLALSQYFSLYLKNNLYISKFQGRIIDFECVSRIVERGEWKIFMIKFKKFKKWQTQVSELVKAFDYLMMELEQALQLPKEERDRERENIVKKIVPPPPPPPPV